MFSAPRQPFLAGAEQRSRTLGPFRSSAGDFEVARFWDRGSQFMVSLINLDQLTLNSVRHSFKPVVGSELAVDMVEVIAKGLGSDPELLHNRR